VSGAGKMKKIIKTSISHILEYKRTQIRVVNSRSSTLILQCFLYCFLFICAKNTRSQILLFLVLFVFVLFLVACFFRLRYLVENYISKNSTFFFLFNF